MRIVLDTNVLVSGLLSPFGPAAEILRMTASGVLSICYDSRIITEYRDVLLRPKFAFPAEHVEALLDQIEACGRLASPVPLRSRLPDPHDEPLLEVALASSAEDLVTGNLRHFPMPARDGMSVVSPSEFLDIYRRKV